MRHRKTHEQVSSQDVLHDIRQYLKKEFHIEPHDVQMYTNPTAELGLDSYEMTGLSIELQTIYGVVLSEDALCGNIADIVEEVLDHE